MAPPRRPRTSRRPRPPPRPGRTGPSPGDRLRRVGASSAPPRGCPGPRSSSVGRRRTAPSTPSRPARRRTCPGARRRCPGPATAASRCGTPARRRGPSTASRSAGAERVRQQLGHPQRPGTASTRHSGPPCSHSSCRQRPHGISGAPVASTQDIATSRPPPVACSARDQPALGAQRHAVRRVLHVAADDHPAVVDQRRPRRPGSSSTARTRAASPRSRRPAARPVDLHAEPIRAATAAPCRPGDADSNADGPVSP